MTWVLLCGAAFASAGAVVALVPGPSPLPVERLAAERSPDAHGIVERLGRLVARRLPLPTLRARLERVGSSDLLPLLVGRKTLLAVAGGLAGLLMPLGALRLVAAPVLGMGGWRLPDFAAARRVGRRSRRLEDAVPDLLDLLALAVSAGLTPVQALDLAARQAPEPLLEPLEACRRRVALGDRWGAALRAASAREDVPSLARIARALDRSARLGTPAGPELRSLAAEVRAERDLRMEERARRAPVLMLFPLVFCILPAFVLSAVIPAVLVATRGIR